MFDLTKGEIWRGTSRCFTAIENLNIMAVQFEFYKSPDSDGQGEDDRYHARVVNFQHITTDYLASVIHESTTLAESDVKSVLMSLSHHMGIHLKDGERVHLEGLGYFQVSLQCTEPVTSIKTRADKVVFKAVTFRADKTLKNELHGLKTERSAFRNHSSKISDTEIEERLKSYFAEKPVLTRRDFERLCMLTTTTASRYIHRFKEEGKLKNINTAYQPIYVPAPGYFGKAIEGGNRKIE